jgi:transcriptional regulator with XRE-family HTH domain
VSAPLPPTVGRALVELGEHVRTWRKLNGLTAALTAERAGISRETLRTIETGAGTASVENLMRVLRILGVMTPVVHAVDPLTTDVGRLRASERLPQRVRPGRAG